MSVMIGSGDGDDIIEAIANAMGGKKRSSRSSPSSAAPMREAVIDTLKELAADYGECRFQKGDLVTPRNGLNLRDAGRLHVILYVTPPGEARHHFSGGENGHIQTHSTGYGRYLDVRVLSFCYGDGEWCYVPFWMESWQLQPYDPAEDPTYK